MFIARLGLATLAVLACCLPAASQEAPASTAVMTLEPNPLRGGAGLSKGATLTISNRSGTYYVLATTAPAGWMASTFPTTISVPSGGTGTAGVAVTPPASALPGLYEYTLQIADGFTVKPVVGQYRVYAPPSVPGGFRVALDRTNVRVTWTASTSLIQNEGLRYTVMRDAVTFPATSNLTMLDTTVSSGSHVYKVRASDAVGNVSAWSAAVSIAVPAQRVPNIEDGSNP